MLYKLKNLQGLLIIISKCCHEVQKEYIMNNIPNWEKIIVTALAGSVLLMDQTICLVHLCRTLN